MKPIENVWNDLKDELSIDKIYRYSKEAKQRAMKLVEDA